MYGGDVRMQQEALTSWLTYQGFLTERLKSKTGDAQLKVYREHWEAPQPWYAAVLQHEETSWCREIVMCTQDEPCWYARTVIPQSTYHAHTALFQRLKQESLGQLIFGETAITRSSLRVHQIVPGSVEYQWLQADWHQHASMLWVRVSEFQVHVQHSFYLIEIFLPFLMQSVIFDV